MKEPSIATLSESSTPNLRPSSNLQDLHNDHSSGLTPPFNPTLLPCIEDNDPFLQPPQLVAPIFPPRTSSPGGSRPSSRASRPENGDESSLPPPQSLKPLSTRNDSPNRSRPASRDGRLESSDVSRPPSQPSSRPSSPTKFRPSTPTTDPQKLSKRRSWLPGKSRPQSRDRGSEIAMPQAWLVTPQEKLPYDPTSLANFVTVSNRLSRNATFICR